MPRSVIGRLISGSMTGQGGVDGLPRGVGRAGQRECSWCAESRRCTWRSAPGAPVGGREEMPGDLFIRDRIRYSLHMATDEEPGFILRRSRGHGHRRRGGLARPRRPSRPPRPAGRSARPSSTTCSGAEERAGGAPLVVSPPLRVTVGDEYQGIFTRLGVALRATRWLRISSAPRRRRPSRPRLGARAGARADEPRVEDGPGWWAAREAVESVEEARPCGRATAGAGRRTCASTAAPGPDPAAVNAALVLRDEMLGGLSERSLGVLRGLLSGRTQREIAEKAGRVRLGRVATGPPRRARRAGRERTTPGRAELKGPRS